MRPLLVTALALAVLAVVVGWAAPVHQSSSATAAAVGPRPASGPLQTGIFDPFLFGSANGSASQNLAFQRTKKAGASTALLYFSWRSMVVGGDTKPSDFDAANPGDSHYRWPRIDTMVKAAVAAGLQPIALVSEPPDWAAAQGVYGRNYQPSPSELKLFATAIAKRYSGNYNGLPRIRYWSVWNEPNLPFYLEPQIDNGVIASAAWYRSMVNNFAEGVHGVLADNMVIAGNLAPFTSRTGTQDRWGVAPLTFMRALLCLQPVCNDPVHFDIWAHHPYTSGGPNHKATRPNDVSLGDLPEMRKVLHDGITVGHVLSSTEVRFWVTEFSYESNPPDPGGLKPGLGARWTSEALYRMWRAGVTQVTWFLLTDQPYNSYFAQSGLYLRGSTSPQNDQPKRILQAFRFPFVAYQIGNPKAGSNRSAAYPRNGIRVLVWGRVPSGQRERVVVEQRRGTTWRPIASLTTNRYGIFGRKLYAPTKGSVRARALDEKTVSRAFSLARPKDRFISPFGANWSD